MAVDAGHQTAPEPIASLRQRVDQLCASRQHIQQFTTEMLDALRHSARAHAAELADVRQQLESLQSKLAQRDLAREADLSQLDDLHQQLSDKQAELAEAREELTRTSEALKGEARELLDDLVAERDRLRAELAESCDTVTESMAERKSLDSRLTASQQQQQELIDENAQLRAEVEQASQQIVEIEAALTDACEVVQERDDLSSRLADSETRANDLASQLQCVGDELASAREQLEAATSARTEVEQGYQRLQSDHAALHDQLDGTREHITALEADVANRNTLEQQLANADAAKREIEARLSARDDELESARCELAETEAVRAAIEQKHERLQSEHDALCDQLAQARKELQELSALCAAGEHRDALAQQLADAEARELEVQQQLNQLRTEIDDARQSLQASEAARVEAQRNSEQFLSEQASLREELDQARHALAELDAVSAAAEQRDVLAQQLADAEARELEVQQQLNQLRTEIDDARQSLQASEAARVVADQQSEQLLLEQAALRKELDEARHALAKLDAVHAAAEDRDLLAQQLADAEARKLDVEQQLAQLCYEIEDAGRRQQETEAARTEAEEESERLGSEKTTLQDELDQAHQALAELATAGSAAEDHDQLARHLADAEARESELVSQLEKLSRDADIAVRDLEETASALTETSHENEQLQAAYSTLSEELVEATAACAAADENTRQLEADYANMRAQLELAHQQLEEPDEAREASTECEVLRGRLEHAESQLQQMAGDKQQWEFQTDTLQRELDVARQRIADLEVAQNVAARLSHEPTGDPSVDTFMQQVKQLQRDAAHRREQRSAATTG